jgi:hypothetical protein
MAGAMRVANNIIRNDLVAITPYPAAQPLSLDWNLTEPTHLPENPLSGRRIILQRLRSRLLDFATGLTPIYPAVATLA